MYKETSGIQRTFIVVFGVRYRAERFNNYINEHGDVPPVDEKHYYESMVREIQINPEQPPSHHHSVPLQYINDTAHPVSDSDCYGDAEQLVSSYDYEEEHDVTIV